MSYEVKLSFNNGKESLTMPLMPSSIEVSEGNEGKTYQVAGLGQINVIKDVKLTEYQFGGIFPAQPYPFVTVKDLMPPARYVETINRWMRTNQPILFVLTSAGFEINTLASIESFEWKETAGSGDIAYTLKLKKYRHYGPRRVVVTADGSEMKKGKKGRANDRQIPKTYTMVAGDTFWGIAKRFLGSGARWPELQKLNRISDAEIRRLPVGKVIKLPAGVKADA
ncbi:peptidoglycan-binding protein LysM [Paenibacillus sp. 32O-W]|uniref:LysM peptidoglycan-binding domain-containing protein n=1 Tax=Paenibacillus sp. 32O-W TaxID=1695218 RepID=UPI00071F5744|nr:LysM peptidoglycan-binding domain-containing protein [Paenibacillus sp. 32O-W]ALS25489.1 peptidoglycan-binding protein LysM [Paenibacillus sp. 32O-W]